jgi:hypothetical protein
LTRNAYPPLSGQNTGFCDINPGVS